MRIHLLLLLLLLAFAQPALAQTTAATPKLEQAKSSKLANVPFDDPPLRLPMAQVFSESLLSAGIATNRPCEEMESYGWQFGPDDQNRADRVFSQFFDRLRQAGYAMTPLYPPNASEEITMVAADGPNRKINLLWSGGDNGLLLLLCRTSATAPATTGWLNPQDLQKAPNINGGSSFADAAPAAPALPMATASNKAQPGILGQIPASAITQNLPQNLQQGSEQDSQQARAGSWSRATPPATSPPALLAKNLLGDWVGRYHCSGMGKAQAVLRFNQYNRLKSEQMTGLFAFAPVAGNADMQQGSYEVRGTIDADTGRILLTPTRWLSQPKGYSNAPLIIQLDGDRLSGIFQGVDGCTSFEAQWQALNSANLPGRTAPAKKRNPRQLRS